MCRKFDLSGKKHQDHVMAIGLIYSTFKPGLAALPTKCPLSNATTWGIFCSFDVLITPLAKIIVVKPIASSCIAGWPQADLTASFML